MGRHPPNAKIGEVVRRQYWSLNDLAQESGITKSYLCGLEHGEHSPSFEVMLRLETAFGLVSGGLQRLAQGWLQRRAAA